VKDDLELVEVTIAFSLTGVYTKVYEQKDCGSKVCVPQMRSCMVS
jgi:hypothetical protein